jgi:hypothetical protein
MTKMSLFVVRVNDSPVAVTETGFGMMLFLARSVGSKALPVQPVSRTAAMTAGMRDGIFIGFLFYSVSVSDLIGFKYMVFGPVISE